MKFPSKIISGGQTGADQGGLHFALTNNIPTGGHMPKGFKTETGAEPDFEQIYGMQQINSCDYRIRTLINIKNSDGTLIFGDQHSSGSQLTKMLCNKQDKPVFAIKWPNPNQVNNVTEIHSSLQWLNDNDVDVLNVAGNRESKNNGIKKATYMFLEAAFVEYGYMQK